MYLPSIRYPAPSVAICGRTRLRDHRGMTLLEMTVVILVLMSLVTLLFVGARTWKRGSDRALCVANIQIVQKGLRGYSNLYGIEPGKTVAGLKSKIIGMGRFVEAVPVCSANGIYNYGQTSGINTIPPVGELYMQCDRNVVEQHEPKNYSEW